MAIRSPAIRTIAGASSSWPKLSIKGASRITVVAGEPPPSVAAPSARAVGSASSADSKAASTVNARAALP